MKSVALHNLGCKVNGYEMDYMQQILQEKGYKIVPFDKKADIYIVNTCTVTNIADRKSRQMLHRAKKMNPGAVVVAAGCYVQAGREEALLDDCIDLAIGNNRKKDLIPLLEEFLSARDKADKANEADKEDEADKTERPSQADKTLNGKSIIDISRTKEYESMLLRQTAGHTRAYIKIQDGCNQFCSYCIIPYARGRVRSRAAEEILEEVRTLAQKGYQEAVLTGIHISSYGLDFHRAAENTASNQELLSLIRSIHEISGIKRIRLGSLEPRIITEDFAKELSRLPKVCPHFHLSLQSGSDAVLKRMNRKYTTGEYYDKVCILRHFFDNPAITTDVMTGFPGETEEEFEETFSFLQKVRFYELHVFRYSKRKGTVAAAMEGQIPESVKEERSRILIELGEELSVQYRKEHLHKETAILFEEEKEIEGKRCQVGYSPEYIKAACLSKETLAGKLRNGTYTGFLTKEILQLQLAGEPSNLT